MGNSQIFGGGTIDEKHAVSGSVRDCFSPDGAEVAYATKRVNMKMVRVANMASSTGALGGAKMVQLEGCASLYCTAM